MRAKPPAEEQEKRRASRRLQRVRLALRWSLLAVAAGVAGWLILGMLSREEQYRAGEEVEGITRELEADASSRRTKAAPAAGKTGIHFEDVTRESGLSGFVSFAGNRTSQLPEDMGGGAAWGDFDNDGDDDLFVTSAGGPLDAAEKDLAPSRLYRNEGKGRFVAHDGFPELRLRGMGAAWADFDNDGWLDIAVSGYGEIRLFRNSQGRFEHVSRFQSPHGFWTGVSWGDFNRDGWPDLYVCGYVQYRLTDQDRSKSSQQFGQTVPHTLNPSSYEPERNLLFKNDTRGGFREVGAELGVHNPAGRSLSALWHDFDDDGWQDLYVANDISESKLYLNRQGRFEDRGRTAWVGEYRGSMGLAASDFDRDGDDDLFISHWVAQQFALYESLLADQSLLREKGAPAKPELHFTDVAEMKGVGQPTLRSIGWGAEFADFDSDGWPDLAVASGSTFESPTAPKRLIGMPSFLFANRQGEQFEPVRDPSQPLQSPRVSRGLAVSDYDNDGDADIAIIDLDAGVRLLRNVSGQGKNLRLRLRGGENRRWSAADGAQVTAWSGNRPARRTVSSASYLSQSTREVLIGLGSADLAERVVVRWPDGTVQEVGALASGVVWRLEKGQIPSAAGGALSAREREIFFWDRHRAAMDKLKRDRDPVQAAQLFRSALAIHPGHEDARYYLASSLAAAGDVESAIRELETLQRINPASHRAMLRLAYLHAAGGKGRRDLEKAYGEALRAHRLNPEETGASLLLAEIDLLRGNESEALRHLRGVVQSNPRAVSAHFLLAYLHSRSGRSDATASNLAATVKARGPEWKPKGSAAEGDVQRRMHEETSLLGSYADLWDGKGDPAPAFGALRRRLRATGKQ